MTKDAEKGRWGDGGEGLSPFPVSPCLRVFSSLIPSCGVAKLVRHRTVNAAIEGSNPSATAKSLSIFDC